MSKKLARSFATSRATSPAPGNGPPKYFLDEIEVSKEVYEASIAEQARGVDDGPPMTYGSATWPLASESLAVHPEQITEMMEHCKKHGVPTEFNKKGQPVFTSPRHRKEYSERVERAYDLNGGYSDPQRGGCN